jgi:hypothetical protein
VSGIGSSLPTASAWWPVEETGQAPAGAMALQLAAKQRSPGEHAWLRFHPLNTVLVMDIRGNHQYELHRRCEECHRVLHGVLVGRVGGWLDSGECHLVAAQSLFPLKTPTRLILAHSGAPYRGEG